MADINKEIKQLRQYKKDFKQYDGEESDVRSIDIGEFLYRIKEATKKMTNKDGKLLGNFFIHNAFYNCDLACITHPYMTDGQIDKMIDDTINVIKK